MPWEVAACLDEIPPGGRLLREVAGRRLAILHVANEFIALDNHCPHRGGPIGAGPLADNCLVCPWHGLKFDLTTGECVESPGYRLTRLAVRIEADQLLVDTTSDHDPRDEQIHRYLVRYAEPGYVGRFGSIARVPARRGEQVVVLTERGQELGEVLVGAGEFFVEDPRAPAGELLRIATNEDLVTQTERHEETNHHLSLVKVALADLSPGMMILDAETTFDGETLILYHAGNATEALGPLAAKLGELIGERRVQFAEWPDDRSRKVASAAARKEPTAEGTDEMRGPYERLKYDFRRVWECPVCHHRERTAGSVTSQVCACQAKEPFLKQVPMKLIEDGPRRVDGVTLPARKSSLP